MAFFSKIKESLGQKINQIFRSTKDMEEVVDNLEEVLILSDVSATTAMEVCDNLRSRMKKEADISEENIKACLREELLNMFVTEEDEYISASQHEKQVLLVVGVNGVGKTTSIAKIANMYKKQGKKVLLVAADTFRAGAKDQLKIWADRVGVDFFGGEDNADPASVVFDGSKKFVTGDYDVLICDTAGRLHNKKNLMDEIEKINRTIDKNIGDIYKEVLMVLDATTGQNALEQVKAFAYKTSVDGLVITKLDSTAKGGVVFGIMAELNIPIKYVGVGEGVEDIKIFDAKEFIENIV